MPEARLANAPFIPDAMSVSPNGFFLAVVKGDRCIVYNLENRTVRKEINAGARITDVAFSPDNSDMALLTDDGVLTIYATRTFDMRKMVDDLGDGVAMAYNLDGKYVGVVKNDGLIQVVNLLNDSDREDFTFDGGAIHDIDFILDSNDYTLMVNTLGNSIEARRLMNLKPYYNRLVNDEVDALMADWLKMMPGETLEEYRARVTDQTRADKRRPLPLSYLRVGLKCGGSDGFSGITANPLVGLFSDWLIAQGGTTVLTEVPEMFGAETILMDRAEDRAVFEQTVCLINDFKGYFRKYDQPIYENPSPGNKKGGITTLEEKSLGCVQKGGAQQVVDVLKYTQPLRRQGLNLLQAPGNDLVAAPALALSGCQLVLFTTGRGTPFGSFVPTMKISTNTQLSKFKSNWIDFNAGTLVEDEEPQAVLERFIAKILATADGEHLLHEKTGFKEIAIFKTGVTL